jgi:asparagine synthetase B (glutamine-hydrolysing)
MDDFFNALLKRAWHAYEPIVWLWIVSLYFVLKLAAEQVKLALIGESTEQMFAGYGRYQFYLTGTGCADTGWWSRGRHGMRSGPPYPPVG